MEVVHTHSAKSFESKVDFLTDCVNAIASNAEGGLRKIKNKEMLLFKALVKAQDRFGTINSPVARQWVLDQGFTVTDFSRHRKSLWEKHWLERKGKEYLLSTLFFRGTGQVTFKITIGHVDQADTGGQGEV